MAGSIGLTSQLSIVEHVRSKSWSRIVDVIVMSSRLRMLATGLVWCAWSSCADTILVAMREVASNVIRKCATPQNAHIDETSPSMGLNQFLSNKKTCIITKQYVCLNVQAGLSHSVRLQTTIRSGNKYNML